MHHHIRYDYHTMKTLLNHISLFNAIKAEAVIIECYFEPVVTETPRLTRFRLTRISLQRGFGLGTRKFTSIL